MSGWIRLPRDILDSFFWNKTPFSLGQAYVDLLLLANYKTVERLRGGKIVTFERGTVYKSQLELAERWKWDRKKVRRFLASLECAGHVSINTTPQGTSIRLEKYDEFEFSGATGRTATDSLNGQQLPTNKKCNNARNNIIIGGGVDGFNPNQRADYDEFL